MKKLLAAIVLMVPLVAAAEVVIVDPGPGEFSDYDQNNDGKIDREEFRQRMIEVFYGLDGNRDAILSIEEWGQIDEERAIRADRNDNGELDVDEFLLETWYDFEDADENNDGYLQQQEAAPE